MHGLDILSRMIVHDPSHGPLQASYRSHIWPSRENVETLTIQLRGLLFELRQGRHGVHVAARLLDKDDQMGAVGLNRVATLILAPGETESLCASWQCDIMCGGCVARLIPACAKAGFLGPQESNVVHRPPAPPDSRNSATKP